MKHHRFFQHSSKLTFTLAWTLTLVLSVSAQNFSVGPRARVQFSSGNLQYLATENRFRFAPEQYDIVGYANDSVGQHNALWQDLFGWASSGYDNTANDTLAIHFQPWDYTCELCKELNYELNQYGFGPSMNMKDVNLTGTSARYDWGVNCTIGNDVPGTCRTLSKDEWNYLLSKRPNAAQLQLNVRIDTIAGLLLMPDGQPLQVAKQLTISEWKKLETQGCVFLPMGGVRYTRSTDEVGTMGSYWTATGHNAASAYFLGVYKGYNSLSTELYGRHTGRSVRLVRNTVEKNGLPTLRYEDALQFRMINQVFTGKTEFPYSRYPRYVKDFVAPGFWNHAHNCAGMAIRFSSNSTTLAVKYCLTNNTKFRHMAYTGIKGMDLYVLQPEGWRYISTAKPADDTLQTCLFVNHMDGQMHEFMIYLPLYDGVRWMQIGVDPDAQIQMPQVENPRRDIKVAFYGTSIAQGGCASRTGMVSSSMIQRELGIECPNLAISGDGRIYLPLARAMAKEDIDIYVLDPLPNCRKELVDTAGYDYVRIFLTENPTCKCIMVAQPNFTAQMVQVGGPEGIAAMNATWHGIYERLHEEFGDRLLYMDNTDLTGIDGEGTVDGNHLTDYGFRTYADRIKPLILQLLPSLK